MKTTGEYLSPSESAKRLGVSTKALRLYEQRGLIKPLRTAAGWRAYGPGEMARAAEIVALRALDLSLAQVGQILEGDPDQLEPALAAHQAALEGRQRRLAETAERVRATRARLTPGKSLHSDVDVAFQLPWPWGGETFRLPDIGPLNFITGPLASGKTRLARLIAEHLPGAAFLSIDRLENDCLAANARMKQDRELKERVGEALNRLARNGAERSPALVALLAALVAEDTPILVVDMIEEGLSEAAQRALMAYLRERGPDAAPLFLLTRSSVILDLPTASGDETIIFCPANHSPPTPVLPYPGSPGFEAVATCLAAPDVRARTHGVIAVRPQVA